MCHIIFSLNLLTTFSSLEHIYNWRIYIYIHTVYSLFALWCKIYVQLQMGTLPLLLPVMCLLLLWFSSELLVKCAKSPHVRFCLRYDWRKKKTNNKTVNYKVTTMILMVLVTQTNVGDLALYEQRRGRVSVFGYLGQSFKGFSSDVEKERNKIKDCSWYETCMNNMRIYI